MRRANVEVLTSLIEVEDCFLEEVLLVELGSDFGELFEDLSIVCHCYQFFAVKN